MMDKKGLGLAGKLIIIFSLLYGLLLAGVLGMSVLFFTQAKQNDARYRVVDVINSIHLARKRMDDQQLQSFLGELFSARFQATGYDLDLIEVTLRGQGTKINQRRETEIEGRTQKFHTEIRDPQTGDRIYTIDLIYSLANLDKGIWKLIWMISAIGGGAFILGLILILLFARSSTSHLRDLASAMQKTGEGDMSVRVEVTTRDEVGILGEKFNWMMRGLEEGEFVKNIFKRYVTRQVAEKILADKDLAHLEGDRREVSILFADIRGFTRLSQGMVPEEIITLLNQYFTPVIDVIIENEGVLDKFIGDGFLAFWNAPLPQEDHALKSCRAALGIKKVLAGMNLDRENKGQIPIRVGIGIHTGTAIAGNVGSSRRMEYTIIGESVNFAERIQEAASGGVILVSERTRQLVGQKFPFIPRKLKIEDYGEEIEVYELSQSQEKSS